MKCRGVWRRISCTDPSVDPESITMSSQRRYPCAWSAGSVSRNAQASLKDRTIMLANGSLIVVANRSQVYTGDSLENMGSFPTPFQVFTHFRFVAQRGYAGHRIAGRSAMKDTKQALAPRLSIAFRAWNEEAAIRATLDSLFQQSLFEELSKYHECCDVLCISNGCVDRTAGIAAEVFE